MTTPTSPNETPVSSGLRTPSSVSVMDLSIPSAHAATPMDRDFALAALGKQSGKSFFAPSCYREAANVMGKTFSDETRVRMDALCTAELSTLPESILQWIEQLGAEILA